MAAPSSCHLRWDRSVVGDRDQLAGSLLLSKSMHKCKCMGKGENVNSFEKQPFTNSKTFFYDTDDDTVRVPFIIFQKSNSCDLPSICLYCPRQCDLLLFC
jgi:hypothetical protein